MKKFMVISRGNGDVFVNFFTRDADTVAYVNNAEKYLDYECDIYVLRFSGKYEYASRKDFSAFYEEN